MSKNQTVCGVEHAKWLDNGFRRKILNPQKQFAEYLKPGDTVIDIGCGPGAFIPDLAKLIGANGKIIAIDLQEEMLELARKKAQSIGVSDNVRFHKCRKDSLDISLQADFILTIYMVHESPEPLALIDQVCELLKPNGYYYLSEPKIHVKKEQYLEMVERCNANGLNIVKESGLFSRTAVFQKRN